MAACHKEFYGHDRVMLVLTKRQNITFVLLLSITTRTLFKGLSEGGVGIRAHVGPYLEIPAFSVCACFK